MACHGMACRLGPGQMWLLRSGRSCGSVLGRRGWLGPGRPPSESINDDAANGRCTLPCVQGGLEPLPVPGLDGIDSNLVTPAHSCTMTDLTPAHFCARTGQAEEDEFPGEPEDL